MRFSLKWASAATAYVALTIGQRQAQLVALRGAY
jgi:hypothetical protein